MDLQKINNTNTHIKRKHKMENDVIETLEVANSEVMYQQDKALIDSMIATAKAFPRDIRKATNNAIAIVTMDKETASTCTYSVPRGGKPITGASVHLARIIAQTWGNIRMEAKVIGVDAKQVTSEAIAFDIETNTAIKIQVKRSILTKTGRMSDDMITVTGNAANSIALRNAIFGVIPRAITDKVYGEAMKVLTGDISDDAKFLKRRNEIFEAFAKKHGVIESEVLASIGKTLMEQITADDLVVLIGIGQAIKDGDTTVELAFRNKNNAAAPPVQSKEEIETSRTLAVINSCTTEKALLAIFDQLNAKYHEAYQQRMTEVRKANPTDKLL